MFIIIWKFTFYRESMSRNKLYLQRRVGKNKFSLNIWFVVSAFILLRYRWNDLAFNKTIISSHLLILLLKLDKLIRMTSWLCVCQQQQKTNQLAIFCNERGIRLWVCRVPYTYLVCTKISLQEYYRVWAGALV